jgi:hypothetical protein
MAAERQGTARQPVDKQLVDNPTDERPIGEIVSNLWLNTETLIRQELQLGLADAEQRVQVFKGQLDEELAALKRELAIKALGGAIAFIGALSLTAALMLLLAEVMPAWVSAFIVAIVIAGGGVLLMRNITLSAQLHPSEPIPKRSAQSLKTDVKTVQEATK